VVLAAISIDRLVADIHADDADPSSRSADGDSSSSSLPIISRLRPFGADEHLDRWRPACD